MLFGGPVLKPYATPDQWLSLVREMAYSAVYFPVDHTAEASLIDAYASLAKQNQLVIAEVGAWSNPLSCDPKEAQRAIELCCAQLELAERIGAGCCVNIAGSLSAQWDGPHPDHFKADTFALIVDSVRRIIDQVKPKKAFYSLELMPWSYPDSADSYLDLIKAIDRPQFAVHLDPVNIVCSPRTYFDNTSLIRDCFAKLGPYIKSCHAKDIHLETQLTVHLNEAIPGRGDLDYRTYLQCLAQLPVSVPLMMEHLSKHEDVLEAAAYIRRIAAENDLKI